MARRSILVVFPCPFLLEVWTSCCIVIYCACQREMVRRTRGGSMSGSPSRLSRKIRKRSEGGEVRGWAARNDHPKNGVEAGIFWTFFAFSKMTKMVEVEVRPLEWGIRPSTSLLWSLMSLIDLFYHQRYQFRYMDKVSDTLHVESSE